MGVHPTATSEFAWTINPLLAVLPSGPACNPLITHALTGDPDEVGFVVFTGFQPDLVSKNGRSRKQCVFHASVVAGAGVAGRNYSASVGGTWKLAADGVTPTQLEADVATHFVADGDGISGHFLGQIKAKDCVLTAREE